MSKTTIPTKVKIQLWMLAGGRCQYEGCNEPLWKDLLSQKRINKAYIAHIIADEPEGPRGDKILSPKLAKDISNLMLMCDTHHRMIDVEAVNEHPVDLLQKMKIEHEDRIEILTSIHPNRKSEVLVYRANVGKVTSMIDHSKAIQAIRKTHYPISERGITLGLVNSSFEDDQATYWTVETENLKKLFDQKVRPNLQDGKIPHLSVFGFAPQPLLILLGSLITDQIESEVYQLQREPAGWYWHDDKPDVEHTIIPPKDISKKPALVLSLSAKVSHDRVSQVMGDDCSIWTITTENPHNDYLKTKKHLQNFRECLRKAFNEIKFRHGSTHDLHVFPVMPVATSIEFGRVIMPKADLAMTIYDENFKTKGFAPALTINQR